MSVGTTTTPSRYEVAAAGPRPSTRGYWVGAAIAVAAMLGAVAWGALAFLGWRAHVEQFPRITSPGQVTVALAEPGTRVLYLEHDRSTRVPAVPAVTVTGPAGEVVPLTAYRGELRYDLPDVANRIGDAVLTFPAADAGTFTVSVSGAEAGTVVAVGDNLVSAWGLHVLGIVSLLVAGPLVGVVVVVVTAVRRSGGTAT